MSKPKPTKTIKQNELLQSIVCALNVAHTNDEVIAIMNLFEKYGGNSIPKWQQYMKMKGDSTLKIILKDLENQLTPPKKKTK